MQTGSWSRRRWRLSIALVMLLQAGLIYLLEKAPTAGPRPTMVVPRIHLREQVPLEPLAIGDPTLFVLPHPRGFSGEAWLNRAPGLAFQPADWTEPPRVLALAAARLGTQFEEFVKANTAPHLDTLATLEPLRLTPSSFPVATPPAPQSALRLGGGLAGRRLLATPELQARESTEILSNSVVQVLVDAAGRVISVVLLAPGSGPEQKLADARALDLARASRFEPASNAPLTVGTLTFEWQTLSVPATNEPADAP